jgi:2-methylcitrate dehydratase PrpD
MTKSLHVGYAASNGILAAKLAQKGFGGSNEIFNNGNGFVSTFMNISTEKLNESIKEIGNPLAVIEPGINIKVYPSCSLTHRVIDSVLLIKEKHEIVAEEIEKVECNVSPRALKILSYTNPNTELEAKFSLQFIIATTIVYGAPKLESFTQKFIRNDVIKSLMKKINVSVHNDWKEGDDARADIVTITNKNGLVLNESVGVPKGNVKNPLNMEQIVEKFMNNTERILSKENQDAIIQLINKFEFLDDISCLMKIIAN